MEVKEAAIPNQSTTLISDLEFPPASTSNQYSFPPVQLTSDLPLPSISVPRPSFIESDSIASDTDSAQPEHVSHVNLSLFGISFFHLAWSPTREI